MNSVDIQLFNIGQKNLKCICVSKIEEQLKNKEDSDISRALLDNSDLVPHVYEGILIIIIIWFGHGDTVTGMHLTNSKVQAMSA